MSLPDLFTYPSIAALSRHLLDAEAPDDILAEVGPRAARQQEASRSRRQRWIEQRLKQPEYEFSDQARARITKVEGQLT
jgi:hypothetical protein